MKPSRFAPRAMAVLLAGSSFLLVRRSVPGAAVPGGYRLPKGRDAYFIEDNLVYRRFLALTHDGAYRQIDKDRTSCAEVDQGTWEQAADGTRAAAFHPSRVAIPRAAGGSAWRGARQSGEDRRAAPLAAAIRRFLASTEDTIFDARPSTNSTRRPLRRSFDPPRGNLPPRPTCSPSLRQIDDAASAERTGIYTLHAVENPRHPGAADPAGRGVPAADIARVRTNTACRPDDGAAVLLRAGRCAHVCPRGRCLDGVSFPRRPGRVTRAHESRRAPTGFPAPPRLVAARRRVVRCCSCSASVRAASTNRTKAATPSWARRWRGRAATGGSRVCPATPITTSRRCFTGSTALGFRAFGFNEWAARLPPLLGAALALAGLGWAAWRLRGERVAWWAVLICGTSVQFWVLGRVLSPDMLLTRLVRAGHRRVGGMPSPRRRVGLVAAVAGVLDAGVVDEGHARARSRWRVWRRACG